MKILINWIISALLVIAIAYIFPGVEIDGFVAALVVALVLGVVNAVIRPVALFLSLPLNILTLGLFTLVVDTLMVLLVAWIVPAFTITTFWWAFAFSITLGFLNMILREDRE